MPKARIKCTFERVFTLTFFCILIVFALIFPVEAASSVGVRVGRWAKYDISFEDTWLSAKPKPSYLLEAENIDGAWNNVTVGDVNKSIVTIDVVTHMKNGTKSIATMQCNITSGEGNFTFPVLIAANRTVGENIVDNPDTPTINNSMFMNFAGANRKVNFIPDIEGDVGWNSTAGTYQIVGNGTISYFYYDRETGILCRFETLSKELNTSYGLLLHWNIVMAQTNLWVAEPFSGWEWWLVGAGIIIVPVTLYYFSRTRKKKHRRIDRRLTKPR
jgi:hypothetical protein